MTENKDMLLSQASARPEFTVLSEEEVWEIVELDREGETPVTAEVNRLTAAYTKMYLDCVQRNGPVSAFVLFVRAEWPIERVAISMVIKAFREAPIEGPLTVH